MEFKDILTDLDGFGILINFLSGELNMSKEGSSKTPRPVFYLESAKALSTVNEEVSGIYTVDIETGFRPKNEKKYVKNLCDIIKEIYKK